MRRLSKLIVFFVACMAALVFTVTRHDDGIRVGADNQLRAATRPLAGKYDLGQLPIFSKTLFYVRENYFDKNRLDPKRMLVGALDFVQRDVPEILIDRWPEHDPKQVTVKVNGQQRSFSIERVDAPWSLRTKLQEIFQFVQPNLQPVPDKEESRRLVEIEMAATNGMLYTLDPHSVLLDVETYKDMRTQTQGKFGGLGIVIEMDKKNRITVKRPMPDTPAIRVGIKSKDHIVRINNESTMNMTLNEAVERLRGDVDTNVDVYIERDTAPGVKKFTITRAFIRPPAIDPPARVLAVPAGPGQPAAKIGYFHMQHFSANSAGDLADALAMFEREKVKGIIMDLRGNPGGLYEQAQKVSDAFIKAGTLVSMVGVGGAQRKDETATDSGHEPTVPLAVLVNQNSASASEIVAGAVKNLDRGVVIGEGTFGKGSVQVLFDIPSPIPFGDRSDDDKLGLKLTTAQYLTPGDLSIQGTGVVPDIETDPLLVQKEGDRSWIRLQPSAHRRREADYEWHLEHPSARKGDKPIELLSYLLQPKPGEKAHKNRDDDEEAAVEDQEEAAESEDDRDQKTDFLIDFARDLLAQAKNGRRRDLVLSSKAFLDKVRAAEDKKVSQALEKLGVDWTAGPANAGDPQLQLTLQPTTADAKITAGTPAKLRGVVKNVGRVTAYRVRAVLDSDNPIFDENEMVFGKIAPGESKSYELVVKIPASSFTRTDQIKAALHTQRGVVKASGADLLVNIEGKDRPMFAYTYQTIDDQKGSNRDGQVQRGEQVRMLVTVKNTGKGKAMHTEAVLRNGTGQEGVLISAGRFEAKELAPGETKTFSFVYEVRPEFKGDEYALDLAVADTTLGESLTDKIKVKVVPAGPAPEALTGTATVTREDAPLRETAGDAALVVGRTPKNSVFKTSGKLGAYTRVEIDATRSAFIATADLKPGGGAVHATLKPEWQVTPPVLTVIAPTVVVGDSVHIKGKATDDRLVRDVYVRVWNRNAKIPVKKAFYQPNKLAGDRTKMEFEADIPLWAGSNLVQVFARESNEVQTLQTIVVLKRAADGSLVAQPTTPADPPPAPPAKKK